MFTGIIESIGKVRKYDGLKLKVETELDGIKAGDSIAVNGICLTVTEIFTNNAVFSVSFDCSPETLQHSGLPKLKPGDLVNLERALRIGDRLGGHFLSGHVEAVGRIIERRDTGNAVIFTISAREDLMKYVVLKGSVGVDGISLTVSDRQRESFSAAVIPHTLANTVLKDKKLGDEVNLEPDMLAKYVENFISAGRKNGITAEMLKENGF